jgi:hypothetical protein
MGAFAFSYPRDEVVMPIPIGIMIITRIKVIYAVIIFAVIETVIVMFDVPDSTAHFAHLGGLVSGVLLAALLIKRKERDTTTDDGPIPYVSSFTKKPGNINLQNLKNLVETPQQKEMLSRIENESVPQVRDIWLEHFIEKTKCPKCGNPLYHLDRRIWCEHCGFNTTY